MKKFYEIEKVSDVAGDGSQLLYSKTRDMPFNVNADWLAAVPGGVVVVGDFMVEENNRLTYQAAEAAKATAEADGDAGELAETNPAAQSQPDGTLSALPTYTANPFVVHADAVTLVEAEVATLENGQTVKCHSSTNVGDYYVQDDDGFGFMAAATFAKYFNKN
jgi:hypothetical protein